MRFKAIIVVAEAGSRQGRPHRGAKLTALEPVGNRPIVVHTLEWLRQDCDCDVVFVGAADDLINVRGTLREYNCPSDRMDYVVSNTSDGVASALCDIVSLVGDAPCLVHPADGLLDESVPLLFDVLERERADLVMLAAARRDHRYPWRDSVYDDADDGELPVAEAGLIAGGALARLNGLATPAASGVAGISRQLYAAGRRVVEHPSECWYRYTGHGGDLLELNRVVLDRIQRDVPPLLLESNRIEGSVCIHPTATVTSSAIIGPTVIGPDVVISDAYIGPYTSVGAGARVVGAEIERAIVSPEASVMNVGPRLTSSLVGRGTRVFRDYSLPRAVRLWVGEDEDVALC